jgi:RNA-directed DNA polymerase
MCGVRSKESRLSRIATTTEEGECPLPVAFQVNRRGISPKLFTLRQKLYRKAKAEPGFRFYTLFDRICRPDVLASAWILVAANDGAPGVDGVSIDDISERQDGVTGFLKEIRESLLSQTYKPQAVRRKMIPKSNGGLRPLGIPTVRDRVVQQAVLLILEPIFEADFCDSSFGFRPNRSAIDALQEIRANINTGRRSVIDADLKSYFDTIPHDKLMKCVEKRIADRSVLRLIREWLQAPIEEPESQESGPKRYRPKTGTPQGGVISPLLANLYLHWLDKLFKAKDGPGSWADAKLVRYADDFVIMARNVSKPIHDWMTGLLEGRMGLTLNREKTKIVHVFPGKDELNFLGYTFSYVRSRVNKGTMYLAMKPSKKSVLRLHQRIRELAAKSKSLVPPEILVGRVNAYLRGWKAYFGHGHRGKVFSKVDYYVSDHLMRHFKRRSQKGLRPPEGTTWYELLTKRFGLMRVSGGLPKVAR